MVVNGEPARSVVPRLADDLRALVRLGLVAGQPVSVEAARPALDAEIEATRAELAARHAGRQPSEIPGLEPARRLYRSFGVDPTRTRPSSEALLRRVVQGKPLPRILNAVDLCNLCALRFLLPIGLYDSDALRGQVVLRRGRAGEAYAGVRKEAVHLEGRIVLADDVGAFGNPTADSMRTAVTTATRSLWMVIFAPVDFPAGQLEADVAWARGAMARHLAAPGGAVSTEGRVI